jgi:phosphoribosylformylglycinamidine synthase
MAIDFKGTHGIATSIGHSPVSALIDPVAGSRNSVTEALTNIVWAPLEKGLTSVSLSANWMWPCNNEGEDARIYDAVRGLSEFAIELGINVPTGKDSLSMKQKYSDRQVIAPGTVIVSAAGHCDDINRVVEPVLDPNAGSLYYISFSGDGFHLGGSSFAQVRNAIGDQAPTVVDAGLVRKAFDAIQSLIRTDKIAAGHDVGSGGLITTLLEMCFAENGLGAEIDLDVLGSEEMITKLFSENCAVVVQARSDHEFEQQMNETQVNYQRLGKVNSTAQLSITAEGNRQLLDVAELRDVWYKTSYLLDREQTAGDLAAVRYTNYKAQPLKYDFPGWFDGKLPAKPASVTKPKAAIIREKGSNSEREMAHAMFLAGFEVKDVHMTDLISGRETLDDIQFIGAVGGFSNSDVLGSAKGWAGAFRYNAKANQSLKRFFDREDTLSIGICNGCQLFLELDLINPDHEQLAKMHHNDSHKHESSFTSVTIPANNSVMLSEFAGSTLGVWISHGEGKFHLPMPEDHYNIVGKYGYAEYPANPNGSDYNVAMMCDDTGRHLVTMPHIERSIFQWNWAHYPNDRQDQISPWIQAFVNARKWIESHSRD